MMTFELSLIEIICFLSFLGLFLYLFIEQLIKYKSLFKSTSEEDMERWARMAYVEKALQRRLNELEKRIDKIESTLLTRE